MIILIVPFAIASFAQSESNPLSFMIGEWKGNGWMMTPNGKQFTSITENVTCKLGCSVLAVDGLGTKLDSLSNKLIEVHNAYGVISRDIHNGKWIMRAYRKGEVTDTEIVFVTEKIIRWELSIPNNGGSMRFTTDFSEPNKWKGTGEYTKSGENWMKIMETELTKSKN